MFLDKLSRKIEGDSARRVKFLLLTGYFSGIAMRLECLKLNRFFFLIRQLQLITVAWGQPLGFLNFVPCETSLQGFFPLLNVSKE